MVKLTSRLRTRSNAFLHDILMVPLSWLGAYWLRFNFDTIPAQFLHSALVALILIVPLQVSVFWFFGLYRGVWRFASIPDLLRIIKAVAVGVTFSMLILFAITRMEGVPRSVPVLYSILLIGLLGGPRFVYRWFKDHRFNLASGQRVLIAGAGKSGEMLIRDLLRDPDNQYQPIALVDDNKEKQGKDIHGVRVYGSMVDIPDIVDEFQIDIIILAMPAVSSRGMRKIMDICEQTGLPVRTLPRLPDLVSGNVSTNALRKVSIEDLLGRDPVRLDWDLINSSLAGKTVLVTGGGGSIGSELSRQIAALNPERLVLVDDSEFNLYQIDMELTRLFPDLAIHHHLDDVTDEQAMESVMIKYMPDIVFHAAAYKHVPMLQKQVRTAVINNILGTRVIASLADKFKVSSFVLISTDKAVNPTNIMGTTKRVCEMLCKSLDARSDTRYITVRFGNVLGSAGSVVPLFEKQIAEGGPVTVTHPDITRYFMTIPEACQLIMQAGAMGEGGETYVLDMGEPVRIGYLAEQMITLAGKVPGEDIDITYTGLRPGEKLYEELFYDREALEGTAHAKIMLSRYRDNLDAVSEQVSLLKTACEQSDETTLMRVLHELVPEYKDQDEASSTSHSNVIPLPQNMKL